MTSVDGRATAVFGALVVFALSVAAGRADNKLSARRAGAGSEATNPNQVQGE